MNEEVIKKIIQCKMEMCHVVVDQLPPMIASEVKQLEKVILESLSEYMTEKAESDKKAPENKKDIQTISIE